MASLHEFHYLPFANLHYRGSKRDSARSPDIVHCTSKMDSQQQLGVKASGFHGFPVAQNIAYSGLTRQNLAIREVLASDKEVKMSSGADGKVLRKKLNKVVLAYTGGLDTSVVVPWLRETYGCEVICLTADVGWPVPVTKKSVYSRDMDLWHLRHEGIILEDPANEPKENMYMMPVDPKGAPDQPKYVKIGEVEGLPISINGMELLSPPESLLTVLNEIGGKHRISCIDMAKYPPVGMMCCQGYETTVATNLFNAAYEFESLTQDHETIQRKHGIGREVYETHGGTVLFPVAHKLKSLTLDRETIKTKDFLGLKYAELEYLDQWECADVRQAVLGVLDETKLFEVAMSLVAPWEITEREDPIEYAKKHNLPQESIYTILEHLRRQARSHVANAILIWSKASRKFCMQFLSGIGMNDMHIVASMLHVCALCTNGDNSHGIFACPRLGVEYSLRLVYIFTFS